MGRRAVSRSSRFTVAAGLLAGTALATLSVPSSAATPVVAQRAFFAKLQAVSASSPSDAWAVGFRQQAVGDNTLAMTKHWDGTRWRVVPSELPGEDTFLWGVADLSTADAWAVGETLGMATIQPFAEHWDGSQWKLVPLNGPGIGRLDAVSAHDSDDVWMVGTGDGGPFGYPHAFIEHWDGSHIQRVKPANLTTAKVNELTSIAVIASDDVWAVGEHGRAGFTNLPLIERYDGTSWSVVSGDPSVGSTANLTGVDGTSSHDAWTVGWDVQPGDQTISALAEHWDGSRWTTSPTVTPGYSSNLTSVSVVSTDDVWAVGTWARSEQNQRSRPLIEHWDGHSWSIIDPPPTPPQAGTTLDSISMDRANDGFVVGEASSAGRGTSYTARWDGTTWSR